MISHCFSSITRHRFPRICEVFVPKEFSRSFDVVWKLYSEKTTTESKCLSGRHDDRQWPNVNRSDRLALYLEVSKTSLRGTLNFLRETQNVFRDTDNFLRKTQNVFRDTNNILRETLMYVFRDTTNALRVWQDVFREKSNFLRETQDLFRDTTKFPR